MKLCYIIVGLTFILSQFDRAESSSSDEEEESINQYDRAEPSSLEETFRLLEIEGTTVKVCISKECKRTAEMLKTFMYTKQNPCTDFYKFACEKFRFPAIFENEVLHAASQIHFNEMNRKILSYLNSDNDHNIEAIGQIQRIFGLCKNEDSIRKFGDNVIQSQLNNVGLPFMPPFHPRPNTSKANNFGQILAKIHRVAAIPFLFSVHVEKDIKNYRINRLYIALDNFTIAGYDDLEPESKYFNRYSSDHNIYELKDYKHTYKKYMKRVVKHLYQSMNTNIFNNNQNFVSDQVHKVTKFLMNAKQVINDESYSESSLEYITMGKLQEKTNKILRKSNIKFNWQQYLLTLFENINDVTRYFYSGEPLIVLKMKYLESIFEVISSINEEVFEAALWWITVHDVTSLADEKLRYLEKKFVQDTNGFNYNRETICLCFAINNFSHALTHLLLKEVNNAQKYIEKISELNENVKISFIHTIQNALWMDESTRGEAINKIKNIETFISHESWVESPHEIQQKYKKVQCKRSWYETKWKLNVKIIEENLELLFVTNQSNEKKFDVDPLSMNVLYNFIDNFVTIPFAFLGLPNFNFGLHSMNYGVLASVIGNSFMQAFGEFGRTIDSSGNERNWWNTATLQRLNERSKCFSDFYDKFILKDEIIQFYGSFSLDRYIGDNVGIKLALSAYNMHVAKYGPEEEKLIGFEKYSSEQLLMIAIASHGCWDPGYNYPEERNNDDIHRRSPFRLRINGMFMNSDRMGAIWDCPVGISMNPREKCYFW